MMRDMNHSTRIRIAAVSTLLFLFGITAGGLAMRKASDQPEPTSSAKPAPQQVVEQTRTVRREATGRSIPSAPAAPTPASAVRTAAAAPTAGQVAEDRDDRGGHDGDENRGEDRGRDRDSDEDERRSGGGHGDEDRGGDDSGRDERESDDD